MKKMVIAYSLLILSVLFFSAVQIVQLSVDKKPVNYYQLMALREAMHTELEAAAVSGHYRSLTLPMPSTVEQVCIVDVNSVDTNSFLCQIERICNQWKNKESNVFFLPTGDSFLLEEIVIEKPFACFPIVDKKFFFTLKQKDGKVVIE